MEYEELECYCPMCGNLIETCCDLNDDLYCPDCGWGGLAYETTYKIAEEEVIEEGIEYLEGEESEENGYHIVDADNDFIDDEEDDDSDDEDTVDDDEEDDDDDEDEEEENDEDYYFYDEDEEEDDDEDDDF
jgi:hypothetical protein